MGEYAVDVLPGEVLGWVREDVARKAPRLWVRASKEYRTDTGDPREMAGIGEEEVTPVMARGVMEISPQRGRRGWTLQLVAEDSVGLRPTGEGEGYDDESDMTPDAFESQFLIPERGEIEINVLAEDAAAYRRFQRWLGRKRARR